MYNKIIQTQESHESQKIGCAFQRAYTKAKWIKGSIWSVTLALSFTQLLAPFVSLYTEISTETANSLVALLALLAMVISTLGKSLLVEPYRNLAASIQRCWDHLVLEVGDRPSFIEVPASKIDKCAGRQWETKRAHQAGIIATWYPGELNAVPLEHAQTLALLASSGWDAELRKRYNRILMLLLVAFGFVAIAFSMLSDLTVSQLVFLIVAPSVPICTLLLDELLNGIKAQRIAENVKLKSFDLYNSGKPDHAEVAELWKDWHRYRNSVTPIFDWLYSLSRKTMDENMIIDIRAIVSER